MNRYTGGAATPQEYIELGYDPIPLRPGTKDEPLPGWTNKDVYRLWRKAAQGSNIGLRAGGEVCAAFIDCDEKNQPGTFNHAVSWLASLGYLPGDYPVIQTASGIGRQVYITIAGTLPGDYRVLAPQFGAGEFRYGPGAYVCAPPSKVETATYTLIDGDYRQLPRLEVSDVISILRNQDLTTGRRGRPTPPRRALALIHNESLDVYQSRSEREQAVITMLVNANYEFEDVHKFFLDHASAGKFADMHAKDPRNAARWLRHSFEKAREFAASHESEGRRRAQEAIQWGMSRAWAGRAGVYDRAVFLAHAHIAQRAGRLVYVASCRDLADLAGVSSMAASKATRRICNQGLICLARPGQADTANAYELTWTKVYTSYPPCEEVQTFVQDFTRHDAFRARGLGKAAAEVFACLQARPAMVDVIALRTGRHPKTVKRALRNMSKVVDTVTGECLPMVEQLAGGEWRAKSVDLDLIAQVLGTSGAGERQTRKHKQERRAHSRALLDGRNRG